MNVIEIILYSALVALTFIPGILPVQVNWQALGTVMCLIATYESWKWRERVWYLFAISIILALLNVGELLILLAVESYTIPPWVQIAVGVPTLIVFLYVSWRSVRRRVRSSE
jgi:hypothetical protein